jgi:hypothetical protein
VFSPLLLGRRAFAVVVDDDSLRGWSVQNFQDTASNGVGVLKDFFVGDAKNTEASFRQKLVSLNVFFDCHVVIATVKFHYQMLLQANKVHNEMLDGKLSSKFEASEPSISNHCPDDAFSFRLLRSKFPPVLQ